MAVKPWTIFKNVYSTCLLIFSITIVMGLIFTKQTSLSQDVHPVLAFFVIWLACLWLSVVEGGQASFVGLQPVDNELYKETHPQAYKCSQICHKGDNLNRYLMGRQFMVIFIVFIINLSGAPIEDAELWGFPKPLTQAFLVSGLAMIFFTAMVGQLQSQVNASHCMLDYCNNYINLFTLYVAMAVEFTGLMHAAYLIEIIVSKLAGKKVESNEPPRSTGKALFFWGRVIVSIVVLALCFTVTLAALFQGKTTMWEGVPAAAAVVLFFILMSIVGMLEGMQIAFFAVAKIPESERGDRYFAKKTCDLLYGHGHHNLPGFMIGRQLSVVSCFFVIARVTSLKIEEGEDNLFGVGDGLQNFFNTGLLGAVITTIVGSISWQLVASAFPIAFLSNPFTYIFLRICLLLEATGVCSGAWVLAWIHKRVAGFRYDEVYIGTPEERAAKAHADKEMDIHTMPGLAGVPAHPAGTHIFNEEDYRFHSAVEELEMEVKDLKSQIAVMSKKLAVLMGETDGKDGDSTDHDLEMGEE